MKKRSINFDSIDFLVPAEISRKYILNALCILDFYLNDDTIDELRKNKVFLNVSFSPGSTTHNFLMPQLPSNSMAHLVTIDRTIIDFCKFSDEEIAATILHEFGHILNHYVIKKDTDAYRNALANGDKDKLDEFERAKELEKIKPEFYADYFAKKIGFGEELKSSLRKYLNSRLSFALEKEAEINMRIDKISSDEEFIGVVH